MEITGIETVQFDRDSELVNLERDMDLTFLRVHTDEGVVGLGETFPHRGMEAEALHGPVAANVLGEDPRDVQGIRDDLQTYFNYNGHAGAEMRALSALDIALWDLKGRAAGVPVYELLGGRAREEIPAYNTCYDDEFDFNTEAGALAESLVDQGITSMKVWPFDPYAEKTRGQRISTADLEAGLEPIREIRETVGDAMDVAVEFHGLWSVTAAKRIVRAVAEYDPMWVEDVVRKGNPEAYARLAEAVDVPMTVSERLIGRYEFQQAMETGAVDVVMPDLCWVGGLSEARAIAEMAETRHLPVAPHNSGGPILHVVNAHYCASIPNLYVMETIRDRYDGWHNNLVTETCPVRDGTLSPPDAPGLGTRLKEELFDHPDTRVRRTEL
ncbi:MAG: mandelate racemase/muconate lactonizing enzyme family protein [Halobacteriaceae archaeon]